jgi:hypothetical protein
MSKDKEKKVKKEKSEDDDDEVKKEDLQIEDDGRLLLDAAKRGNVSLMEQIIKGFAFSCPSLINYMHKIFIFFLTRYLFF